MKDKVKKIREEVARIQLYSQSEVLKDILDYIDKVQEEPVSKVWHDPDEEPEVERTIIWEDEKMMGKHLFQGQWKPKIDVFGRKERWCYLSDILNL